jgi:ribonuclease P protein component
MSKTTEYLKSIGVTSKVIAELEKADKDDKSDLDVKPFVEEFQSHQKKLFENDPDLESTIAKKEQGKMLNLIEREIKKAFNLSAEQIKDKDWKEIVVIAKETAAKNSDKTLQELQTENTELAAKVKKFEEEDIPKIKSEVEIEKKQFHIDNKLRKFIPKEEDLRVPSETVDLVINKLLKEGYDLDIDDSGELQVFVKGKRTVPKSEDGTKLLGAKDIFDSMLKKNKFVKESNADDTTTKKDIVVVKTGNEEADKKKTPHQIAAEKHLEEIKKQKEAAKKSAA